MPPEPQKAERSESFDLLEHQMDIRRGNRIEEKWNIP
ncbi:hypothetical protein Bhyg_01516 [Pseudolycoriella hygida]|uniref:Uncharacterized protein n=1 Tax=Pseudolycoriella hygida TaxID=35572 RepID=A0A9Q0N9P0_9DIPT|nr:hypothetical protein Bhyg_01516 [Pseudolycoriella hygida]